MPTSHVDGAADPNHVFQEISWDLPKTTHVPPDIITLQEDLSSS